MLDSLKKGFYISLKDLYLIFYTNSILRKILYYLALKVLKITNMSKINKIINEQGLEKLCLPTLEDRRQRGDMIQMYKV
jgi:hypothetical protein